MEIWKDVKGYEGLFKVSNRGRVLSLKYRGIENNEKIMTQTPDKDGYLRVGLRKEGKTKVVKVHRLVAEAFIENKEELPVVNHKDEDKTNNNVENLEWCSVGYNNKYSKGLYVVCYNKENNRWSIYTGLREAERRTGSSSITSMCKRRRHNKRSKYIFYYLKLYKKSCRGIK